VTDNHFRAFWQAGYTRLVPIVPPGAPLSPKSSLALRMAKNAAQDARGKAPGVRGDDGLWRGIDWLKHETTEADLERWHAMQAGTGIRTGAGLVALDIDTLNEALAEKVAALAELNLGEAPVRLGRAPKRLLLYATNDTIPYQRVLFDDGLPHRPGAEPRVELLSDDRQFVAAGIHPVTGKPYRWLSPIPPRHMLPMVSAASVAAFFAHLATVLPSARAQVEALPSERANVDQAQLLGDPDTVARAVASLPNTTELFPTYDDYVRVGYAIKGATQDDAHGLELFQQWAARWDAGGNDPDRVAADWQRMKPPFSVGAQYLYELAQRHGSFTTAEAWFDGNNAPGASADPWAAAPSEEPAIEPIKWANLTAWRTTEAPPREWDVNHFIPRGVVTLVYGEGGVGKTLSMHQYAVCAAAGIDWLGQKTRPARVMCVFCEDDEEELHRRHRDILKATGADGDLVDRNLRIVSRAGEDNLIVTFGRSNGAMQRTAFWHQIAREAVEWEPDVLILDTIADIFGGSEIDRMQVNSFVKVGLGGLSGNRKMSTLALGHPSIAGKDRGYSGSTAWSNASRSRIYLRRPKGKEKGNLRELEGMKANRGPVGNLLQIEWKAGAFSLVAASTQIDLNAFKTEAEAVAVRAATIEEREEGAVLAALAAARAEMMPLGLNARVHQKYAPRVLRACYPDLMAHVRSEDAVVEDVLRRLLRVGRVREAVWKHPAHRYNVAGYEVVTADTASSGVFN
jgi:hypothetical protein